VEKSKEKLIQNKVNRKITLSIEENPKKKRIS
jgi:hypothetical protein